MKAKNQLEDVVYRVGVYAKAKNDNVKLDPFTILTILNCLISVIRLVYECSKDREHAKATIKSPGVLARFSMRRQVRKHFPVSEREAMYNAMLSVSASLSDQELNETLQIFESGDYK